MSNSVEVLFQIYKYIRKNIYKGYINICLSNKLLINIKIKLKN